MQTLFTKFGAKILTAVTLFVIVFSPLQPMIAQAQQEVAGPAQPGAVSNDIGCNLNPLKFDAAVCLSGVVYVFTVGIGSGFAYVAAYLFDLSIQLSLSSTSYGLAFISQGWTTARDIANMAFLFILLYIAFMIMFQAETSGATQMLAWVIAVALLVNFSFFFTRVVIDAGNILSIQFYNAINAPPISSSGTFGASTAIASNVTQFLGQSANTKDLTADIMGAVNLQQLFSTDSFQKFVTNSNFFVKLISLCFLYIGMGVMLWLLTVMFATIAVKFLFRIAVLWFLIIASPLALVSRAVPNFRKYYDQWQHLLISHAFYPAVFMFIFLILSSFARQVGGTNLAGAFTYAGQATQDSNFIASLGVTMANIGIRMGLIIAVLYIGLEASKQIGTMGASMAHNFGSRAGGWFRASTVGLAGRAGGYAGGLAFRETFGRGAANDLERLKKNPPKTRFGQYFDYAWRKNVLAPIAGTSLGGVKSQTDIAKYRKERKEDWTANQTDVQNTKDRARLEELEVARPNLDTEYKELQELKALEGKAPDEMNSEETAKSTELKSRVPSLKSRRDDIETLKAEKDKLSDNISKYGKRELGSLKGAEIESILKYLSESQLRVVKELEKFSDKERRNFELTWNKKSGESSYNKANKHIELLRDIKEQLKKAGIDLKKIDQHTKTGVTMTSAKIKEMRNEITDHLAAQRQNARDGSLDIVARKAAEQAALKLQDMVTMGNRLAEESDKVGAEVGDEKNKGEYKVK